MPLLYLRTLRRRRKLTQATLAELSGVAQNAISRLETETGKTPTYNTVVRLATALKVHPSLLRFGPDPAMPPRERRIDARPLPRRRVERKKRLAERDDAAPSQA